MGCYYVVTDHIGGASTFPPFSSRVYRRVSCARNGSVPARLTKKSIPDVWSRTKSRSRSLFTKTGSDVDLPTSRASKAELGGRKIYN